VSNHLALDDRPAGISPSARSYPPSDLMLKEERAAMVPLSEPTIWRLERDGQFPRRIKIGPKRVAWLRSEVTAWIAAKAAARSQSP
jgi:prophage regulatory protein